MVSMFPTFLNCINSGQKPFGYRGESERMGPRNGFSEGSGCATRPILASPERVNPLP
jgi:hypothetical protein